MERSSYLDSNKDIPLTYSTLNDKLLLAFPELTERVAQERQLWGADEPGPHIIYGDVFLPYLVSLLEKGVSDSELEPPFRLLEALSAEPDPRVQEVAAFSVLEGLLEKTHVLERALLLMGPHTRHIVGEIQGCRDVS